MEEDNNLMKNDYATVYLSRLTYYIGYGAIFTCILSRIFLMKYKPGLIFGAGLGAGYCNKDLKNLFTHVYFKK